MGGRRENIVLPRLHCERTFEGYAMSVGEPSSSLRRVAENRHALRASPIAETRAGE